MAQMRPIKPYRETFGIDVEEDFNEPYDKSKVKHLDKIDKGVESKCLTCAHYCKDGAEARITTVTSGDTPWHIGANYCTLLGYYPLKKQFPVSLNSPIGPDGHVLESPEVIKCSEYQKGSFMKLRPILVDTLAAGMSEAEEQMNTNLTYFNDMLKKASRIPFDRFDNTKIKDGPVVEVPIEFGSDRIAQIPGDVGEIIEIACGPLKFKDGQDFIALGSKVTWTNPAFMVGPHALLTIKYHPKK